MFERYTAAARLLVFLARKEAGAAGAAFIEPEHLLLASLAEETSVLSLFLSGPELEAVAAEARALLPVAPPRPEGADLPLSDSAKHVLSEGADAAALLQDRQIRPEHLLLGLLEQDTPAAHLLARHNITRARVMAQIQQLRPAPIALPAQITRESVAALVANLTEPLLKSAYVALVRLQANPPAVRPTPSRIADLQREMQERWQKSASPGTCSISGGGGSWNAGPNGELTRGHFSSSRIENGTHITETHRFFEGHEIALTKRMERTGEHTLSYSQEIEGPKRRHNFTLEFDLS